MAGNFALFRCTNADDIESTDADERIEFDGNAATPNDQCKIISFYPSMKRRQTDNPAPFMELNRKPDTGFVGNTYIINVIFKEFGADKNEAIARLRNWAREDNFVRGDYRNGRFGLRNDYRPEFNLTTPNDMAGYKIQSVDIEQDLQHKNIVKCQIIMEFSGDPSKLGT